MLEIGCPQFGAEFGAGGVLLTWIGAHWLTELVKLKTEKEENDWCPKSLRNRERRTETWNSVYLCFEKACAREHSVDQTFALLDFPLSLAGKSFFSFPGHGLAVTHSAAQHLCLTLGDNV